jgi:hypothetical protein
LLNAGLGKEIQPPGELAELYPEQLIGGEANPTESIDLNGPGIWLEVRFLYLQQIKIAD